MPKYVESFSFPELLWKLYELTLMIKQSMPSVESMPIVNTLGSGLCWRVIHFTIVYSKTDISVRKHKKLDQCFPLHK